MVLPFGAASLAISDDTAANDLAKAFELTSKPILVDVPAQVANEKVLDTLAVGRSLSSLALLHHRLGDLLGLALL